MAGALPLLPIFNNQPIYDYFGIAPEQMLERKAISFLRRVYREEISTGHLEPQDRNKAVCDDTIEKMEFRYDLYKKFKNSFFMDTLPQEDVLTVAVICDEYVNHICEKIQNASGDITGRENEGFELSMALRAQTLWDNAFNIECRGELEGTEEFPKESLFLAHINAWQNLRDYEATLEQYDAGELPEIIEKNFVPARKLCMTDTEIGRELIEFIDRLQPILEEKIRHDEQVKSRRAAMAIVHSSPTEP